MVMIYILISGQNTNQCQNGRKKKKMVRENEEQCKTKYLLFHFKISFLEIFIRLNVFQPPFKEVRSHTEVGCRKLGKNCQRFYYCIIMLLISKSK